MKDHPSSNGHHDATTHLHDAYVAYGTESEPIEPPRELAIWKQVLLWIAVLPVAVLGACLAHAIIKVFAFLSSSYYGQDSWWQMIFTHVVPNGCAGYALVFVGSWIAPRCKITVAIVLAAATLCVTTLATVTHIQRQDWWGLTDSLATLVGAIMAAVAIATGDQDVGQQGSLV